MGICAMGAQQPRQQLLQESQHPPHLLAASHSTHIPPSTVPAFISSSGLLLQNEDLAHAIYIVIFKQLHHSVDHLWMLTIKRPCVVHPLPSTTTTTNPSRPDPSGQSSSPKAVCPLTHCIFHTGLTHHHHLKAKRALTLISTSHLQHTTNTTCRSPHTHTHRHTPFCTRALLYKIKYPRTCTKTII